MSLNNAELAVVLKEVIDPEVADLVERTPTLYKLIPKGGEMNARGGSDAGASGTYVSGKDGIFMYAKVQPNPSLGWFGEGGKYPAGSFGKRVKFSAGFSRVAITSRLTRDVFEGADKSAIINVVTEEIADDTKSILKEISQQLYGDGSGKKATVSAITSAASGILTFAGNGTSGLHIRGKYDIISGDASTDRDTNTAGTQAATPVGTVIASALSVGAKTNSTATFGSYSGDTFTATDLTNLTISGVTTGDGGTVLATDMIVPTGSYQKCISGLDYHINSGTGSWQNISRSTYPQFRAYTYASVGALTVAKLYKVIFQARYARRNDILEGEYVILSAPTQTHAYALLGDVSSALYGNSTDRTGLNAMPAAGTLDYGFRNFKFAGINWIEDIDCPPDTLYVINFNKFKIHEFKPLSKVFDGNGFLPVPSFEANDYSSGAGSYTDNLLYTMTWKGQLVTKDPQMAGIKMTGLTTTNLALPTNDFAL
jgi:hypothetical protein